MAVAQGYGKTVTSGSVFAYDVADFRNSFKGKPTTNLLTQISKIGTNDGTYFKSNSGTEVKHVPGVGVRTVHYVNIFNDYNGGSGICCPSLMNFGTFNISPSTVYTYQIIFKTTTGYANTNYMYHYEFNSGTYVTEYGLWNSSRQVELGDGWIHAWGTFTSNASANTFQTCLFHYEYGVWNKVEVAGILLTQGSNIIPPTQFLDVNTTRSATQGLLPLVGNSTLDLSNVSFDSNAQMTFDGTNDYFSSGYDLSWNNSNSVSIEFIIKRSGTGGGFLGKEYPNWEWSFYLDTAAIQLVYWTTAGGHANGMDHSTSQFMTSTSNYYHVIYTWNGSVSRWYVNSALDTIHTATDPSLNQNRSNNVMVGGHTYVWADSFAAVQLPVLKFYNRALSAAEIKQNYLHYKTRFNLS